MKAFTVAAAAAVAQAALWTEHERKYWSDAGRASAADMHEFTVGMAIRDFDGLHNTLMDISNPKSANYGKWLSTEEANALTNTPKAIVDEVYGWATSTGAQCIKRETWLKCRGSVAAVERLTGAQLRYYRNTAGDLTLIRSSVDRPGMVPEKLTGKVTVVTGLSQLPLPSMRLGKTRPVTAIGEGAVDYSIVPQTLFMMYNATDKGAPASSVGPIEFQAYPAPTWQDQNVFVKNLGIKNWTLPFDRIVGPFDPQEGSVESALDEQYIAAVGEDNEQWYWTEADWQYEFASTISTVAKFPNVMSMSYAWWEGQQCVISPGVAPCNNQQTWAASVAFVKATNALFAKAVARGITLLSASGDSGAHGRSDPTCTTNFTRVEYPASSPYVTAVGATELQDGTTGTIPNAPICKGTLQCATGGYEVVASNKAQAMFDSGGGFSNITARKTAASWQDAVVSKYITNASAVPVPGIDFNTEGRGVPDVAALGHNYYVEIQGPQAVDGTSAATPVWGGLIANLNAWRLSQGKPVIGFANPLLYQAHAANPKAFHDVVQGDNQCTESDCTGNECTGYFATPGWDATTGLGTPNYGELKATIAMMLAGK